MNQFAKPGLAEEKLPPVSTADNGKVCTVEDGVWKAKTPSGGSGGGAEDFVATFTGTTEGGNAACDKTFAEIKAAYDAGKNIKLFYEEADWYKAELQKVFGYDESGFVYIDGGINFQNYDIYISFSANNIEISVL